MKLEAGKKQTVVEQMLDSLKSITVPENPEYMYLESNRQYWLKKEAEQIVAAVEWNCKSNMGEVYYNSLYNKTVDIK